jgi:acetolactate synthase-1/2/3 large subunit
LAFGVPGGGSNLDVVGACQDQGVEFVLTHTENAAAIMAAVAGELTGAPVIALATRGPGAASAVNGVAQALLDRQPMVMITDCVAVSDELRISHQRINQRAMLAAVSNGSFAVNGNQSVETIIDLTRFPKPGPVHIDVDPSAPDSEIPPLGADTALSVAPTDSDIAELVAAAMRPVVIVGAGAAVLGPKDREALAVSLDELGARLHVPVLCTYNARGFVPDSAPWCGGIVTGATIEAPMLAEADLIIGVGLDPVELIPAPWPYSALVVLFGTWPVDDSTFFGTVSADVVVSDLSSVVSQLAEVLGSDWHDGEAQSFRSVAMQSLRSTAPSVSKGLTPHDVVIIAREVAPPNAIATVDAGAHMLVAMPLWQVESPGKVLISSGLATMGFALPAAIAAALVEPESPVVCFTGDGGLGMVLAELETAARLGVHVIVVVFNDSTLSLIAAKQQPDGHGGDSAVSYRGTDFAAIAGGFQMWSASVDDVEAYKAALVEALSHKGPALIDVRVDPSSYPAVLDSIRG